MTQESLGTVALCMWNRWRYHHRRSLQANLAGHQGIPTRRFGGEFLKQRSLELSRKIHAKKTIMSDLQDIVVETIGLCAVA